MAYNFWLFYIGGIVTALVGFKSKNKRFFCFWLFVAIFVVMSSAALVSDLQTYEWQYRGRTSFVKIEIFTDWAFMNLMYLLKLIGCSFMEAKAILMLVIVCLLYRFLRHFSPTVRLFSGLLFLLVYIFQTSMILRNGIGFMIVLQGFWSLISDKRHKTIKYIIYVLIGAQFHKSLYFMLLFALMGLKWEVIKKYRKLFIPLVTIGVLLLIIFVRAGLVTSVITALFNDEIAGFYGVVNGRYAWLSLLIIWGFTCVSCVYFASYGIKSGQLLENQYFQYQLEDGVIKYEICSIDRENQVLQMMKIILLASFFVPFTKISLHLYRFLHYIAIIYMVNMGVVCDTTENKRMRAYGYICTFFVMILWLIFEMFIYGGFNPELMDEMLVQGTWFWD